MRWADTILLVASALALPSCECEGGPRRALSDVPAIPYPVEGDGEVSLERVLVSGPDMQQRDVVERFELRDAGEHTVLRVRQAWALGTADLDVVYDAQMLPLRVWRRTTMPDASGQVGHHDLRVYDLGGDEVRMARRGPTGEREGVAIRGPRPRAVIGPGRGLLTAWIQRADLEVGERLREPVLDVREPLAVLREVTLKREAPREVPGLGEVRVYTIYGREPVYTDDENVVVGDMFGLRWADAIDAEVPEPMGDPGPLDPRELP